MDTSVLLSNPSDRQQLEELRDQCEKMSVSDLNDMYRRYHDTYHICRDILNQKIESSPSMEFDKLPNDMKKEILFRRPELLLQYQTVSKGVRDLTKEQFLKKNCNRYPHLKEIYKFIESGGTIVTYHFRNGQVRVIDRDFTVLRDLDSSRWYRDDEYPEEMSYQDDEDYLTIKSAYDIMKTRNCNITRDFMKDFNEVYDHTRHDTTVYTDGIYSQIAFLLANLYSFGDNVDEYLDSSLRQPRTIRKTLYERVVKHIEQLMSQ